MSASGSRLKRVAPERSGPIRNPVVPNLRRIDSVPPVERAVFGDGGFDSNEEEASRARQRPAAASGGAVQDAVECGVRTAYAVIDEYMRRGREAAVRHRERPDWSSDMSDNRYNYGHPNAAWGPMWPFIAPWMQAMQAWACAMTAMAPGAAPYRPWDPQYAYGASGCATLPRVSVKVTSQYRTEVSACIEPGAEACALTADPLKDGAQTDALPLKGIEIKAEHGHVYVCVTVPIDQPAGKYSGAIRDSGGCKRGELKVDISK